MSQLYCFHLLSTVISIICMCTLWRDVWFSSRSWLPLTTVVHSSPVCCIRWHYHQHTNMTSRWRCDIMTLPCYLNQTVVLHRRHHSVILRHQLIAMSQCLSSMTSWMWRQMTTTVASSKPSCLLSRSVWCRTLFISLFI